MVSALTLVDGIKREILAIKLTRGLIQQVHSEAVIRLICTGKWQLHQMM